jgi:hypothetical protein
MELLRADAGLPPLPVFERPDVETLIDGAGLADDEPEEPAEGQP